MSRGTTSRADHLWVYSNSGRTIDKHEIDFREMLVGAVEDFESNASESGRGRLALIAACIFVWIGVCLYFAVQAGKSPEIKNTASAHNAKATERGKLR